MSDTSWRAYSDEELGFIAEHQGWPAWRIAEQIGRSKESVCKKRRELRKGWVAQRERFSESEDEFILSTPHLTARQVATHLGRHTASVEGRRHHLAKTHGVSFDTYSTKSPFHIGARPLIAKTCTKCGLLLPSDWFSWNAQQNGTGGWRTQCRKCVAAASADLFARTPERRRDESKHATGSRRSKAILKAMTAPTADRGRMPWLDADHEILRDPDLTLLEKAIKLRRTYNATTIMCSTHGYRSHVGLGDAERDLWVIDNPNAGQVAS